MLVIAMQFAAWPILVCECKVVYYLFVDGKELDYVTFYVLRLLG